MIIQQSNAVEGAPILAIRKDSATALAGTDNDFSFFQVDDTGRLRALVEAEGGSITVDGVPELTIVNAIDETAFDLNAAPFSEASSISNDYILNSIELNFSTAESKTITVTTSDGTILYQDTNINQNVSITEIQRAFNTGENFTVAVTQFSSAGTMDCIAVIEEGSATLGGNPVLGAGTDLIGIPYDFYTEVQKGNVSGHSLVHKFGRNDDVPNGSWDHVSLLSTATSFLSAATTVRIKAGGDAADDASGAGAREITVQGIDTTLAEVTETIATAGASASSATTASFWRVHRAWISSVGTYGEANTAAVTIENSAGGTDLIMIAADEGQSQYAGFTIPTGKTGYILSITVTVDASKAADIRMFTRENITDTSAPMSSKRLKLFFDGVLGTLIFKPESPMSSIAALSDIWFEARGGGAGTEVSIDFELLLVDD